MDSFDSNNRNKRASRKKKRILRGAKPVGEKDLAPCQPLKTTEWHGLEGQIGIRFGDDDDNHHTSGTATNATARAIATTTTTTTTTTIATHKTATMFGKK